MDTIKYLETLEKTEKGNYIVPTTIESIEYNTQSGYFQVKVYNENLEDGEGDIIALSISDKSKGDNGNFVQTPESIKRADELCLSVFNTTYEELGDIEEELIDKEINIYMSVSNNGEMYSTFEDTIRTTFKKYGKHTKKLNKKMQYKLSGFETTNTDFVVEFLIDGVEYGKKFAHANQRFNKMTKKPIGTPKNDSVKKFKSYGKLLKLFGTINPEFNEETFGTFSYHVMPSNNAVYVEIEEVPQFADKVDAYLDYVSEIGVENIDKITKPQVRDYLVSIGEME